jgi:predicted TIM-barrel fold metal-dependent hydrolase
MIDSHVHAWSNDRERYPIDLARALVPPPSVAFTVDDLLRHASPFGVTRFNVVQISFFGIDNSCLLDVLASDRERFVGTAVIDPLADRPEEAMAPLIDGGIRAFRIHPKLSGQPAATWLQPSGYERMFAFAAKQNLGMSCLIEPAGFAEIDRMCRRFPDTPVLIDHLGRIGLDGKIREAEIDALCGLATHPRVMVKISAFYALGKKQPPYLDLSELIRRVVQAFGADRCMWASDSPYQTHAPHTYGTSIDLIRSHLGFLTDSERKQILQTTAERFFFGGR